jgi:cytochrome c553
MKKLILFTIAPLLLIACSQEQEATPVVADATAGKAIAEARCAACHGMDGRGAEKDIPNLAAQPVAYLVDAMNAYKDGRRHHAALQDMASDMSDADIYNIASYYAGLPPLEVAAASDPSLTPGSSYQEGAEVAAVCTACHGEHGFSREPGIPSLAGQQPAYLIISIQEYARGERGHKEKEAMLQGMEQVDIEKMALYFASQIPATREAPPFGDPARGEPLSGTCGECHGDRGISHDPLVPSLAGQEPNYLVSAITAYRDGDRAHDEMVADRTDEEVEDIAAYYSIQKAEAAADQMLAIQELAAKCDRCHGSAVGNSTMVVPSLKGQNRDYLVRVMKAYRDEDRGNSMMHKMSANYSDETIEAIATYYSGKSAD